MTALLRPHHTDCPCLICQEPAACCCDPCDSVLAGEEPDMALGDICMLCLRRERERCGARIDVDEDVAVEWQYDHPCGNEHGVEIRFGQDIVCEGCVRDTDRVID